MKRFSTNLFYQLIVIFAITLMISSCRNQVNNYDLNPTSSSGYGNISGKVYLTATTGVSGIEVRAGNLVAYTDNNGKFFIEKVPVGDRVLVNFKSDNYTPTQKIVVVKANRTSDIEASVIAIGKKQNLNATSGGSVVTNGLKVDFTANSFVDSKGNAFTGTVQVNATYFDPSTATFYGCFPGEFKGVMTDNSTTQIESFGFINVELLNGKEKLQLATGKTATFSMPIASKILAKAPAKIQLWYYDETKGQWIEEGTATKSGSNYIGTVKHFSSWNCDMPSQTSFLKGRVVDANGNPLSFVTVHETGNDYTGSSSVRTDDNGKFKINVKSLSSAKVWASYHIFTSTYQDVNPTPATGDSSDIGDIILTIDSTSVCFVIGRILDNANQPVSNLYIYLLDSNGKNIDNSYTNSDGKFQFMTYLDTKCTIQIIFDYSDSLNGTYKNNITTPQNSGTMDLGDIKLDIGGSTIIGRTVDSLNNPMPGVNIYNSPNSGGSGVTRESKSDSLGKFSISARPNKTFSVYFSYKPFSKTVSVTSGNLGETVDLGDVILK